MVIILKILALIASWVLFYKILKSRNKRLPGLKATLVTLLFAALIFRVATDIYGFGDRAFFSLNKQGEVKLSASPLRIPLNQDRTYCNQFTDHNKKPIDKISERKDGNYCGEFWKFDKEDLMLPYKIEGSQVEFWASPSLRIYGPGQSLEKELVNTTEPNKKE